MPVDRSLVTGNLRVVIPPSTLRALVASTNSSAVPYLRDERSTVDVGAAVESVVDNVKSLADGYLTDAIVHTKTFGPALDEFGGGVNRFLTDVRQGRRPSFLTLTASRAYREAVVPHEPLDHRDLPPRRCRPREPACLHPAARPRCERERGDRVNDVAADFTIGDVQGAVEALNGLGSARGGCRRGAASIVGRGRSSRPPAPGVVARAMLVSPVEE